MDPATEINFAVEFPAQVIKLQFFGPLRSDSGKAGELVGSMNFPFSFHFHSSMHWLERLTYAEETILLL